MKMIAQVSPDRFRGGDVRMRWKGVTFFNDAEPFDFLVRE